MVTISIRRSFPAQFARRISRAYGRLSGPSISQRERTRAAMADAENVRRTGPTVI